MQSILYILNVYDNSGETTQFACKMAIESKASLRALITQEPIDDVENDVMVKISRPKTSIDVEAPIKLFLDTCYSSGIPCSVLKLEEGPIQQTIHESRFVDFIIVDGSFGFGENVSNGPSMFIREILSKSECPVILYNGTNIDIKEIYFCYDGSASVSFAIKQFTSLLPVYKNCLVKLLVIAANGTPIDQSVERFNKWLQQHYSKVEIIKLEGEPQKELYQFLADRSEAMVVMGAYGRPLLSRLLHKSAADSLLRSRRMPLFITHK